NALTNLRENAVLAPVTTLPKIAVLTEADVALVRHTYFVIEPIADVIADLFYERLFYLAPSMRRMFPDDMTAPKRNLMVMVATTVQNLDNLDALIPLARALGVRHARYGVSAAQYQIGGDVLMWTLERGLARDFTPEVRDAWRRVYDLIAAAMQDGANE